MLLSLNKFPTFCVILWNPGFPSRNPGLIFSVKFVSNQPLGESFLSPGLCSGIHSAPDRASEGRGIWQGRHQGMAVHEQLRKSCNGLIIQISLHFFFGCRRQGGALVRRCCRWDGASKGREQKAGSRTEVTAPVANIPGKSGPCRRVCPQGQRMEILFPLPFPL